jgi:hypothetical protein
MSGLYDKKETETVIARPVSYTYLHIDSGDRFNPNQPFTEQVFTVDNNKAYNDFVINRQENLLQGQFKRVGVSEVRFPYAIPNVNTRNNTMWVNKNGAGWTPITIPEGFYDGPALATAIDTAINVVGLNVVYSTTQGNFTFDYSGALPSYSLGLAITDPSLPLINKQKTRSLWDLIGLFYVPLGPQITALDIKTDPLITNVARLKYTDYIDIVSENLTNHARSKDNTTQNLIPRSNIICRLYIENEVSTNTPSNVSGTYPFTIYRQFTIPKMMEWANDKSIGQIDIKLYDMYGDPLYIPLIALDGLILVQAEPPDFQITLLATEN